VTSEQAMTPTRSKTVLIACLGLTFGVLLNATVLQGRRGQPLPDPGTASIARPTGGSQDAAAPILAASRTIDPELIKAVQLELQAKGYRPGTADGTAGFVTRAAILAYEMESGLPLTAEPSEALLSSLLLGGSAAAATDGEPSPAAKRLIAEVQGKLARLGYGKAQVPGAFDAATEAAIRRFEKASGLPQTGRIGGRLAAELMKRAGA
jgi:peptidoglycan hydrolase-like protein with peptidoglycan-binding domain